MQTAKMLENIEVFWSAFNTQSYIDTGQRIHDGQSTF